MDYRKRQSMHAGLKAEHEFGKILTEMGYTYVVSSTLEDTLEHWDFRYADRTVDVKGRKDPTKDAYCWVELQNVAGKTGWLFGDADEFAFELVDAFLVVDKLILQTFMRLSAGDEWYLEYTREGRQDIIVKVPTIKLLSIGKILKKCDQQPRPDDLSQSTT